MRLFELEQTRTTNPLNNGTIDTHAWEVMDSFDDAEADIGQELKQLNPEVSIQQRILQVRNMTVNAGVRTTIPINKLISTEPDYDSAHVKKITGKGNRLPLVYKQGNSYVIADGNHRVIAEFIAGQTSVAVNLVDIKSLYQLADRYFDKNNT